MRRILLSLSAVSLVLPMGLAPEAAQARHVYHRYSSSHYRRCTHSGGTTGAVVGGTAGALAGNGILGHGALGTVAGGVGGFFAGRAIDRSITAHRRCR